MKQLYTFILPFVLLSGCTGSGNNTSDASADTTAMPVADTAVVAADTLTSLQDPAYMRAVIDSIRRRLPKIEDFPTPPEPSDSITVLDAWHNEQGDCLYTYVNHNRACEAHRWFEPDSLQKVFTDYLRDESGKTYYQMSLERSIDSTVRSDIDSSIHRYKGYWVYVFKYPGQRGFYLDDDNEWKRAFHIGDSIFSKRNVEGPDLFKMTSFRSDAAGNFAIRLRDAKLEFQLIDQQLGLYRQTIDGKFLDYTIPAVNSYKFDIICYTGNPGGMFSSFEKIEEE